MDDNDETIHADGNLLRSIIVTEVKMRPKGKLTTSTTPHFVAPPPPTTDPPPNLLDENDITDDFRRSIDDALRGLEAVYQTASLPPSSTEHEQNIPIEKIATSTVNTATTTTTTTRTSSPPPMKVIQYGVTNVPIGKSKEKTIATKTNEVDRDNTKNLADIIRQMAEQQKIVSERLANQQNDEIQLIDTEKDVRPKLVELVDEMNELIMDSIEVVTAEDYPTTSLSNETIVKMVPPMAKEESEGEIERLVGEIKEHGERSHSRENLPSTIITSKQPSSYSIGLTSPIHNEQSMSPSKSVARSKKTKLTSDNRPKSFIANEDTPKKNRSSFSKQISLDELASLMQTGLSNPNLPMSTTKLGVSTSSGKIDDKDHVRTATSEPFAKVTTSSISRILEEHQPIVDESAVPASSSAAALAQHVVPVETKSTVVKSPVHNVTYTEIIHSESRDGEQSRRFVTESYNEHPSNDDEQTTTLKVVTKSEFSNDPTTGEKIMEQSVQVITVKVRNETIKTTVQHASIPSSLTDHPDGSYERRPVSELVKNFETVTNTGTGHSNGTTD